jgi:hypothetical protein
MTPTLLHRFSDSPGPTYGVFATEVGQAAVAKL